MEEDCVICVCPFALGRKNFTRSTPHRFPLRLFYFKIYPFILERRRETSVWLPVAYPLLGNGLQPRRMPWLGLEPATLWFPGWHSIHWATSARTSLTLLIRPHPIWHILFTTYILLSHKSHIVIRYTSHHTIQDPFGLPWKLSSEALPILWSLLCLCYVTFYAALLYFNWLHMIMASPQLCYGLFMNRG